VLTTDPDTAGKIKTDIHETLTPGSQNLPPVFRRVSKKLFSEFFFSAKIIYSEKGWI